METNPNNLAGWTFQEEEVSAGVYRVTGIDHMGRKVQRSGTDPDRLKAECRRDAQDIQRRIDAQ